MAQQVLYETANGAILQWQDTAAFSYAPTPAGAATLTVTPAQWEAQSSAFYVAAGALVAGALPAPAPTLAQQAAALLAVGLTITSTATPALNGVYACDDAAQAKLSRVYGLIERAGGAFPAALAAMPWTDQSGAPHVFPTVAQFLALETAVGDFVLACDLIIATNSGTLPPATAAIP
jgi:hypothetical protein